jgi:hypothetical protein
MLLWAEIDLGSFAQLHIRCALGSGIRTESVRLNEDWGSGEAQEGP